MVNLGMSSSLFPSRGISGYGIQMATITTTISGLWHARGRRTYQDLRRKASMPNARRKAMCAHR
jgi:hypothetical protein